MSKSAAVQASEPVTNLVVLPLQSGLEPSDEGVSQGNTTVVQSGTNSYCTDAPQFTKAISEHYGVTRKSVQDWVLKIREAYPWFTDVDLKLADGRHSALMVGLVDGYRSSGLPFPAWKEQVWSENPELMEAWKSQQQSQTQQQSIAIAPYHRSGEIDQLLSNHKQTQITHESPDESPLVLALRQRLASRETENQTTQAQLKNFIQANADTQLALETLEDLEAIQEGEAVANRIFFLREQAKLRCLEKLKIASLGKPQAPDRNPPTG